MTIVLYDIPSNLPEKAWSPNTWKTRFCLNYKGIPYKTEWVEYPDIENHCKKLGILPTSQKSDGSPFYTLPAIHDTSTGVYVADSFAIAEYLEKTYPSLPSIFPDNTQGIQSIVNDAILGSLSRLWRFIYPAVLPKLNPPSAAQLRHRAVGLFGMAFEDVTPKGDEGAAEWTKLKNDLDKPFSWYSKSSGPFLLGDKVSWADFNVASCFIYLRLVWGEESKEWKDISTCNNGRWKNLLDDLKQYQTVA